MWKVHVDGSDMRVEEFIGGDPRDEIMGWYEKILSSRHERILAQIGGLAYDEIMLSGVKAGLLRQPDPLAPSEFRHVTKVMLAKHDRKNSEGSIPFRSISRELGARESDLLNRRCVELPTLFDVLRSHRNKRAHPGDGEITEATLCALAGTVLSVLELSSERRLNAEQRETVVKLREVSENALAYVVSQVGEVNRQDEIEKLREELSSLQDQKGEMESELAALRTANDAEGTADVSHLIQNAMTNIKAHVTKRINEIKDEYQEMGRQFEIVRDAVETLRDERPDYDDEDGVLGEEGPSDAELRPMEGGARQRRDAESELTAEVARQMLRRARRRLEEKGWDIRVNVFQPWIVEEALEKAATEGLGTIDDWWNLSAVGGKSAEEWQSMQQQLEIPECKSWMIGIYSRVERRGG